MTSEFAADPIMLSCCVQLGGSRNMVRIGLRSQLGIRFRVRVRVKVSVRFCSSSSSSLEEPQVPTMSSAAALVSASDSVSISVSVSVGVRRSLVLDSTSENRDGPVEAVESVSEASVV